MCKTVVRSNPYLVIIPQLIILLKFRAGLCFRVITLRRKAGENGDSDGPIGFGIDQFAEVIIVTEPLVVVVIDESDAAELGRLDEHHYMISKAKPVKTRMTKYTQSTWAASYPFP